MATPLFEPPDLTGRTLRRAEQLFAAPKTASLFGPAENHPSDPDIVLQVPPQAKARASRSLDELLPKISELANDSHTPASESFYAKHPALIGKSPEFVKRTAEIDKDTDIRVAADILGFAAQPQKNIGELVSRVSEITSDVLELNVLVDIRKIVTHMRSLTTSAEKRGFWGRKNKTLGEFIDHYDDISAKIGVSVNTVHSKLESLRELMSRVEDFSLQHSRLDEELDMWIAAGSIITERYRKAILVDSGALSMADQFNKRLLDLSTFRSMMDISIQQNRLNQSNLLSQAMEADSVLHTSIPLWRSAFSSMLLKLQGQGIALDTVLEDSNSGADLLRNTIASTCTTIVSNIERTLNVKPV